MAKRVGKYSVQLEKQINMVGGAAIVGKLEKEGPLGEYFDYALEDDLWNEDSWEKAETKMFYEATRMAVKNSGLMAEDIQLMMGGDLLNQLIAAGFAARQMDFPFLGLYGACSTMAESLIVGSMAIDAGFAQRVACCVTSHFSTAERQYRTPLELGTQRTPTAQRTVTGAGASVLAGEGIGPRIKSCTIGKVIDYEIRSAEGKYGVADVAILRVEEGAADEIMASLENRRDDRINEFSRYDVYDSYEIALNATIYQADELVVILMLDENSKAAAMETIDSFLP